MQVVDSTDSVVRELSHRRYRAGWISFRWFGRDLSGGQSPDGTYQIRVQLRSEHRTILFPNLIRLDTSAPAIEQFGITRRTIRAGERTRIAYRFSERARPIVLVDSREAVLGRFAKTSGTVDWYGKVAHLAVRPGVHRLTLMARDDAGNTSNPTAAIPVQVRGLEPRHRTHRHNRKR